MSISRRLILHILPALMLFVGVSPAAAASGNSHEVIDETIDPFTIDPDQCPLLPAGVGITGTGQRHAVVNIQPKADGTTEIRINDLVTGTATDSNGGVHKFVYHNSSTQTILLSGFTTIRMNDSFELTGPGPHYSVGFNWRWTFTQPNLWPPVDNWEILHGDPDLIIGPDLNIVCDPL
jgi:hypothetical protein